MDDHDATEGTRAEGFDTVKVLEFDSVALKIGIIRKRDIYLRKSLNPTARFSLHLCSNSSLASSSHFFTTSAAFCEALL